MGLVSYEFGYKTKKFPSLNDPKHVDQSYQFCYKVAFSPGNSLINLDSSKKTDLDFGLVGEGKACLIAKCIKYFI